MGEAGLLGLERGGVDATAEAAHFNGVLEVKHLVEEEIFEGVAGAGWAVKDAADDDGVVGGVVMAERALGVVLAPGEVGAAEQPAEKARVERIENLFKIEVAALGTEVALAATSGADELGLARDGGRGGETLVAQVVRPVDGLAVKLSQENVCDGVEDGFGRPLEKIGEAGVDLAFAKANGGVQRGESPEADMDGRHGRARANDAVFELKDGDDVGGHGKQDNRCQRSDGLDTSLCGCFMSGGADARKAPTFDQSFC